MPDATCPLPLPHAECDLGEPPAGWECKITAQSHYQLADGERHCSAGRCPHRAVVILTRRVWGRGGQVDRKYGYCGCHMGRYGVWIQDGHVVRWQMRRVASHA